jgi:16S rRNA (guanine1207-N2)-methyltransferase
MGGPEQARDDRPGHGGGADRPSHYFDATPLSPSAPKTVHLHLPDGSLTFTTDRGMFSPGGIDPGTKYLLLEAPPPPSRGNVLDLGCGYGPIACTMARRAPDSMVWAVDVNERAVALCASNAAGNGLTNVRTMRPDEVPTDVAFDAIYSNPPIRIGKGALHGMLMRWLTRLVREGHAYLVVQKHLGADSLAVWLRSQGFAVERLGSRQAYRLLEVRRPS